MARYLFTTRWHVDAPIDSVWDILVRPESYPAWWPHVAKTELLQPGAADGLGDIWRTHFKTALPYDLKMDGWVVRRKRPNVIELATVGELVGSGRWTLTEKAGGTEVEYEWNVSTSRLWMNFVAPITYFLFAWNHNQVMDSGAVGMARRLGASASDIKHTQDVRIAGQPAAQISMSLVAVLLGGLYLLACNQKQES
ncbi:MAG: SRPBCC family protein [Chloroflexota bacterium]